MLFLGGLSRHGHGWTQKSCALLQEQPDNCLMTVSRCHLECIAITSSLCMDIHALLQEQPNEISGSTVLSNLHSKSCLLWVYPLALLLLPLPCPLLLDVMAPNPNDLPSLLTYQNALYLPKPKLCLLLSLLSALLSLMSHATCSPVSATSLCCFNSLLITFGASGLQPMCHGSTPGNTKSQTLISPLCFMNCRRGGVDFRAPNLKEDDMEVIESSVAVAWLASRGFRWLRSMILHEP